MKSISDRLAEQISASEKFSQENFGLMVGDGYPELARELLGNEKMAARLAVEQIQVITSNSSKDIEEHARRGDICAVARNMKYPKLALAYLYYGIEIGRALEREASAVPHG